MRALATALLGVAVAAAPAQAQRAPKYDPDAVVTVTGVVVDSHESKARNDHPGLHFMLEIALAPEQSAGPAEEVASATPLAGGLGAGESPPAVPSEPTAPPAAAPEPPPAPEVPVAPEPPVTKTETVEVHACPMELLGYLDFPIEKGDELTVTGSRPGNGPIIVAREIEKGTVKLQVRDAKGVPIWTDLR